MEYLDDGNITLLHATGSDPGWATGEKAAPDGFASFYEHYQEKVSREPDSLQNGYAITYHDSLAIAVTATRITEPQGSRAPSAGEVAESLLLLNHRMMLPPPDDPHRVIALLQHSRLPGRTSRRLPRTRAVV